MKRLSRCAALALSLLILSCSSGLQQQLALANSERQSLRAERDNLRQQNEELSYNLRQLTERLNKQTVQESATATELAGARNQFLTCEQRRLELENADVGQLQRMVGDCKGSLQEVRAHGFADGQLNVLRSIEIIGTPDREEGVFVDDYYYTFQVKVGGRNVILTRIRTHKEETAFAQMLGSIREVAMAFAARK